MDDLQLIWHYNEFHGLYLCCNLASKKIGKELWHPRRCGQKNKEEKKNAFAINVKIKFKKKKKKKKKCENLFFSLISLVIKCCTTKEKNKNIGDQKSDSSSSTYALYINAHNEVFAQCVFPKKTKLSSLEINSCGKKRT